MSPAGEAKQLERRLNEFGNHLKKVDADVRSHRVVSEDRKAALQAIQQKHRELEKRVGDVDETTWNQVKHTLHSEFEGIRSKFDAWVSHVDEKFVD